MVLCQYSMVSRHFKPQKPRDTWFFQSNIDWNRCNNLSKWDLLKLNVLNNLIHMMYIKRVNFFYWFHFQWNCPYRDVGTQTHCSSVRMLYAHSVLFWFSSSRVVIQAEFTLIIPLSFCCVLRIYIYSLAEFIYAT